MKSFAFVIIISLLSIPAMGNARDISGKYKGAKATISITKATGDVWQIECRDGVPSNYPTYFFSFDPYSKEWKDEWGNSHKCYPLKKVNNKHMYRVNIASKIDCPGLVGDMAGQYDEQRQVLTIQSRDGLADMEFDQIPPYITMSMAEMRTDQCGRLCGDYRKIK